MNDRRAVFFVVCAVVALVLVPLTPAGLEYVGVVTGVWCGVLGLLSALDARDQGR